MIWEGDKFDFYISRNIPCRAFRRTCDGGKDARSNEGPAEYQLMHQLMHLTPFQTKKISRKHC